ncbi:MAG TPA: tail fiber domain-containing protein [Casimicrobiaceae bacterium]|nr:tail fiber domain-containing protein [Casimicrobiaceae bacterium]
MFKRALVSIGVAAAIGLVTQVAVAASLVRNQAVDVVGLGATADPLLAIEANRQAIVHGLANRHAAALTAAGIGVEAFRAVMASLRADQLLAASLVDSLDDVTAIATDVPVDAAATLRFTAITPASRSSPSALPRAPAYVVREGDALRIVKAADFALNGDAQVVGYFAPAPAALAVIAESRTRAEAKDGPGSGAGSWIGYTAGSNVASGSGSAVAAGKFNAAVNTNASIFAGQSNSANGVSSLVIGGFDNHATAIDSLVGAGAGNRATGARAVVVGGGYNLASGQWAFIGGGGRQTADGASAGGSAEDNVASGNFSTVGGGQGNRAGGTVFTTVAGGKSNNVFADYSAIAGGLRNTVYGVATFAAIAGGIDNTVVENRGAIGGGESNTAGPYGAVGGGRANIAGGAYAAVPGGEANTADGAHSFAGGHSAHATARGEFVWADGAFNAASFEPSTAGSGVHGWSDPTNTFNVRATGGAWFVTGLDITGLPLTGPYVTPGSGAWAATSDRAVKENFQAIDARDVLARVSAMPIASWNYITEGAHIRHLGPVSQDFYSAFTLGANDKSITSIDEAGVALAAIQGLHRMLHDRDEKLAALEHELTAIKAKLGMP